MRNKHWLCYRHRPMETQRCLGAKTNSPRKLGKLPKQTQNEHRFGLICLKWRYISSFFIFVWSILGPSIIIYPQSADCFTLCPDFWVINLDFGVPCQGSEDLHCFLQYGQLFMCYGACARTGCVKTETFPLDCGRYHGCLYEPRFGMPFSH